MKFLGHTRYSLSNPDSGAWKASNGSRFSTAEEYRKYLYDPSRLQLREEIFLKESLPIIKSAADSFEIRHVVSFSDSLPQRFKDSLYDASNTYEFLLLDERPDGERETDVNTLTARFLNKTGVGARYRLDDDDVLSAQFFHNASKYLKPEFVGFVVSFPVGIEAIRDGDEIFCVRQSYYPLNAQGMLYVCARDAEGKFIAPKATSHTMADRANPTITDGRQISYLRYDHPTQDNNMTPQGDAPLLDIAKGLLRYPPAPSNNELEILFPSVKNSLSKRQLETVVHGEISVSNILDLTPSFSGSGYEIRIKGIAPKGIREKSYLLKMNIVQSNGNPVSSDQQFFGIGKSPNPQIGFYKYFEIKPGPFDRNIQVLLDEAHIIDKITIQNFGDQPDLKVSFCEVERLA